MKRLPLRPLTYLITPGECSVDNFQTARKTVVETIKAAISVGVSMVQVREKALSARDLFELAADAVRAAAGTPTLILINDRADIAAAVGADGVHLTRASLPAAAVRSLLGPGAIIGVSAHAAAEIVEARDEGASFAVFGPVFASPGKGPAIGIDGLTDACRRADGFPVIALGGIDDAQVKPALDAGAAGVAGIRAFNDIGTLTRIIRNIRP